MEAERPLDATDMNKTDDALLKQIAELEKENAALKAEISRVKKDDVELSRDRARFQVLSENAPFGLILIDKDANFKYVNPKFIELFGYDLADVPNGREWFKRAYPDPGR